MMEFNDTIKITVPRITLVKGKLIGKYRSDLDLSRTYSDIDKYFILDVYQAYISDGAIDKEQDFELREKLNKNIILRQPIGLSLFLNGEVRHFEVDLIEYEVTNPILFDVVSEQKTSFGTINADIKGLIRDTKEIEIPIESGALTGLVEETEKDGGRYTRYEYIYEDVKYFGNWTRKLITATETNPFGSQGETRTFEGSTVNKKESWLYLGFRWFIYTVVGLLLLAVLPTLWPLLCVIALFWAISFLANRYSRFGSFLNSFLSILGLLFYGVISLLYLAFWGVAIYGFFHDFSSKSRSTRNQRNTDEVKHQSEPPPRKDNSYIPHPSPFPKDKGDKRNDNYPKVNDEWITNKMIWQDYESKEYSGDFAVLKSNREMSRVKRNTLLPDESNQNAYWNSIYYQLVQNDFQKLDKIYEMLDSIKESNNLNARQFANVMVSCVQHIPYVIILNDKCNPNQYEQKFIKEYLRNGGDCQCCARFGIYSPVEFASNLRGDCDTRTLLLFTLFTKFGYDAVVLNSDLFGHSILGVSLPSRGVYKKINGAKYYVWETTAKGMELGELPSEISNMNLWFVVITNK
jgi:hypothetical protein